MSDASKLRIASEWNNRATIPTPKQMGPRLGGVKMGLPGTGVPVGENTSYFKDVEPMLPAGGPPAVQYNYNIFKYFLIGAGILFLLHLARG